MRKADRLTRPARRLLKQNASSAKHGETSVYMPEILDTLNIFPGVFDPTLTRVSKFLAANLRRIRAKEKVLELGTGSGFIAILLAKRGAHVTATDIDMASVSCARQNAEYCRVGIAVKKSDLFSALRGEKFDAIVFNPPLIPARPPRDSSRLARQMSKSIYDPGLGIIRRFFRNAEKYLTPDGKIILVYTDIAESLGVSRTSIIEKLSRRFGYSLKILATKTALFETYTVYMLKRAK